MLVRVVGLYFAYCTLVSVFAVAASIPDLFSLPKIDAPSKTTELKEDASELIERGEMLPTSDPEKEKERLESERLASALKIFFMNLGLTALYAFAAWYFIRDGRFVFDALAREEPGEDVASEREVTRLNLESMPPSVEIEVPAEVAAVPKKKRASRKKKTEDAAPVESPPPVE